MIHSLVLKRNFLVLNPSMDSGNPYPTEGPWDSGATQDERDLLLCPHRLVTLQWLTREYFFRVRQNPGVSHDAFFCDVPVTCGEFAIYYIRKSHKRRFRSKSTRKKQKFGIGTPGAPAREF